MQKLNVNFTTGTSKHAAENTASIKVLVKRYLTANPTKALAWQAGIVEYSRYAEIIGAVWRAVNNISEDIPLILPSYIADAIEDEIKEF